jgi:hypothetical protein
VNPARPEKNGAAGTGCRSGRNARSTWLRAVRETFAKHLGAGRYLTKKQGMSRGPSAEEMTKAAAILGATPGLRWFSQDGTSC